MKKNIQKILFLVVAVLFVFSLVSCDLIKKEGGNTEPNKNETEDISNDISLLDWMQNIPDTKLLSQITIPGTHDSGASDTSGINGVGATQIYSIEEQLDMGYRAFDIRIKYTNEGLKIFHGVLDQNLFFSEVETIFKTFLDNHPSETIIMMVKNEGDEDELFNNAVNPIFLNNDIYFCENRNPTLQEIRGKIVLFKRYDTSETIGLNARDGWGGDTFTLQNGVTMHIQDNYYSSWWTSLDQKWEEFIALYDIKCAEEEFYINFASCYVMGQVGPFEIPVIETAATKINKKIIEEFALVPSGYYGLIYVDYADEDIAITVISKNFN